MKNNKKNGSRAFSFVEVMVTVFLVSVGLLASLSLLTKGLAETMDSRNQLIGSLLAQEGVELVRARRDYNLSLEKDSFFEINNGDNLGVRYNAFIPIANGDSIKLKYNVGFYEYYTGNDTKFYRKVKIDAGASLDEKVITSMVVWTSNQFKDSSSNPLTTDVANPTCNSANKCAYAVDILTNWAQ